ncbi:glyoxylate/hydroxypyruvate reductase A [Erwinia sp. E602]|uniref:2-hydroxyacid dehydrogenase n=1 Tax=unclassified Erwinia TaxID=2622719 RepID=UPI0006FFB7C4|nr:MULTISPECIES: glyoxylate/hydroxypyruvate reductase A [unclassified Erwinia]KQN63510.1 glyoxylate/hydroxypyruvate reductase A [Erwinia sp. Leaf53]PLV51632.1 2-hydroxyacid dehydrogenase [Erwinia sp. B116]QUG75265.1 glyoxylate/hydroxypyruvate reductase A [Erwinia sp. E602]
MNIVYKSEAERGRIWAGLLADMAPEASFRQWPDVGNAAEVEYLVAWQPPEDIMQQFPNLKVLFSVGAGADQFDYSRLPADLPVVRMIEPGLTSGMVEYVTFAVLGLHRDMPRYLQQQRAGVWQAHPVQTAAKRRIGVMGLGTLGEAVLKPLVAMGFDCGGWSRTPRDLPGVRCWAGDEQLGEFLARSDILICLLPLTERTEGMLNADLFGQLPAGAALVQAGRGAQLNHQHLLDALDAGQLSAAVVDVTAPEPLPAEHRFWHHPQIWLTPHIASQTQPESAVVALLANIRRHQRGEPMVGVVDRQQGY